MADNKNEKVFEKMKLNEDITLKTLIARGRELKHISQRELARRIGLSHSSINDLENGRVKKPDIEILMKISEKLDLSLKTLLISAGYERLIFLLSNDESLN